MLIGCFGALSSPSSRPNFHIERSDHISTPGQINAQVIDRLLNSRLVIADLSMLNPNVFYEIGIRHMVEMPIIHLQREDDPIPFDVAIYRAIKFSLKEFADLEGAQGQLAKAIGDVLDPAYVTNNPVTEARGRVKLRESATPEQQILLEDMARLKARMSFLETRQNMSEALVDPTIVAPGGLAWQARHMHEFSNAKPHFVLRNPPFKENIPTVIIDVARTGAKVDKILEVIRNETNNPASVSIVEGDKQMIEVTGEKDDMRRLYEALRGHVMIGDPNVLLVGD
jgi:hypothetical protein